MFHNLHHYLLRKEQKQIINQFEMAYNNTPRTIDYDLVSISNGEFKPLKLITEKNHFDHIEKRKLSINIKNLGVYQTDYTSVWYAVDSGNFMTDEQLNKSLDKMIRQLILEVKFYSDDGYYLNLQDLTIYQNSLEYLLKMAVITSNKYLQHLQYLVKYGYRDRMASVISPSNMELARRELVKILSDDK